MLNTRPICMSLGIVGLTFAAQVFLIYSKMEGENWKFGGTSSMSDLSGPIIGAAGTIAALTLSIWGTGHKDRALIEKDTKINSQEHDKLSAEHSSMGKQLSMEHHSIELSIRDGLSPIRQKTEAVHDMFLEDKAKKELWYSNLSESQRDMKAQFESLQKMASQWEVLVSENEVLKEQVKELTKERDLSL